MDPFEPSNLSQTAATANTTENVGDNDNPLGILAGPPVKAQVSVPIWVIVPAMRRDRSIFFFCFLHFFFAY
jgi:hypothetical protein